MKKIKFLDIIIILFSIIFFVAALNVKKIASIYPNSIYFIIFIFILMVIFDYIQIIRNHRYRTKYLILLCKIVFIGCLLLSFYYHKAMPPFQDNPSPEYLDKVITSGSKARKYMLLGYTVFLLERILKIKKFEIKKDYNVKGEKNEQYH